MESDANVFQAFIGWVKFYLHFHTHFSLKSRGGTRGEERKVSQFSSLKFCLFVLFSFLRGEICDSPAAAAAAAAAASRESPHLPHFPLRVSQGRQQRQPSQNFSENDCLNSPIFSSLFFFLKNPEQHSSLFELASCPLFFSSPFQRPLRGVRCDVWVSERSSGLSGYETTEIFFSRPEWTLVVEEVNSVILYKQA